ncbi:heme o synthase [Tumebacillus flagellatus]|uniref:Protoheme IX farnesyltransferase n=1 Tax=Tumebacillus flagellatus TaxID=1157490 RepID=A0A074LNY2_9BACL|nr:heme o synthase [Tumebacillus flagellatus]KEO82814.1 protoheme IX farnesyltransferase [Tumebacillus flagellatus]
MEQTVQTANTKRSNPVMEPGPLSETGTWRDFVSVTKVGITVANLMTVFAGLWLSSSAQANGSLILWTLLGTALVIMAGTCLNNYIDRDLDRYMERTAKRALAKGSLNPTTVMWMGIGFAVVGTAILTFLVNPLTAIIGLIGLFDYVVVYTMWLKRTSTLSTIGGAISGAVPIVMGWTAYSNSFDMGAFSIFLIMFMWQMPHTLALSIRRSQDYGKAGIPVLPVVKGFEVTKRHMMRWVAAMIPASILVFNFTHADMGYLVTMMVLGLAWFIHTIFGFFANDTIRWARQSFVISLIYLTSMSIVLIVETSLL